MKGANSGTRELPSGSDEIVAVDTVNASKLVFARGAA